MNNNNNKLRYTQYWGGNGRPYGYGPDSYCRERTPKGRWLQPVQLLPSIPVQDLRRAWCSCCLSHPHTPGFVRSYSPWWRGPSSLLLVCCLCLLVAHTYQAILVLLPNSPMHPQKCTQDAWLIGAITKYGSSYGLAWCLAS